ncbi:MAG: phosphoesterase [Pseudomonadales bacterium]|nr:phosphoesterase [Pseudomonadales bacterium]
MKKSRALCLTIVALLWIASCQVQEHTAPNPANERQWLAGDHHIHSRYSVGWNPETDPPSPIIGGDAIYPTPMNAVMASHHGLSWMVTTDHGGPHHSKVNLSQAWPELQVSRQEVPDVIQFYGMELNTPGADHSSLIIAHSDDEAQQLFQLESRFDKHEPWPADPGRDNEDLMIEALQYMEGLSPEPVVIANHPSRSATGEGAWGLYDPAEFRRWNDTAPNIAIGMAGAPGHQAAALKPDGSLREQAPRGAYRGYPTLGGFDQMTAQLGGFWDSMLGEGRRWWITANSDSHINWAEGGYDFWPGEYSKTYVFAQKNHDDILRGLREGHVFVTTGDLVSAIDLTVTDTTGAGHAAMIGETLEVPAGSSLTITIRFLDPGTPNFHGDNPRVNRIDLIGGLVSGKVSNPAAQKNDTTRVIKRFDRDDFRQAGDYLTLSYTLENVTRDRYLRVRGTNTNEAEPEPDPLGENPWNDLWFYSNPVFIRID